VAFLYSAYATIAPGPGRQVYFDAVLLILGFLLLGKSLEGRAKRRALGAINALTRLRPVHARRIVDGVETLVPLEEVRVGDRVVVLPGERFPVDATIEEGRTTVDESMLTGESTPLEREAGGRVLAGSLNYDGAVVCKAESLGEATVLEQIARMVDQAQSSRAPMERLADRASAIFVPVVLGLALVTFANFSPSVVRPPAPADGAGKYGGGAGDRMPVRDGSCCAGGTDGGGGPRRAAGSALQRWRSSGAAGPAGCDRAG
jgi:cation transport ATPase